MSAPLDGASPTPGDADPDPTRTAAPGATPDPTASEAPTPAAAPASDLLHGDLMASVGAETRAKAAATARDTSEPEAETPSEPAVTETTNEPATTEPAAAVAPTPTPPSAAVPAGAVPVAAVASTIATADRSTDVKGSKRRRGEKRAAAAGTPPPPRTPKRRRPRRTWPQRGLIAVNILLVLVCFMAAGGMTYVKRQIADVKRIDVGTAINDKTAPGEPLNFLMVGIDNDYGLSQNDPVVRGRDNTLNTDTIMLLRIDPGTRKAWILSLPRDLYVAIPGTGSSGRINTALSIGGPGKLVETIKADFGITVNHYVQIDFAGFEQLVETLGGVPIYFDKAGRDTHSGLAPTGPGCVTLDGPTALAFARSRYYEVQDAPGGFWRGDPTSDIGREQRQQAFIRAAMKKAIDRGARNPYTLSQLIGVAQQSVRLDQGVTTQTLLDLGEQFRDFDPDALQVFQPSTTGTYVGAAAVLMLNSAESQPIFDIFRGVDPTVNIQRSVRVQVRSGSGALNRASEVRGELAKDGFTAQSDENALYKSDTTVIRYAHGSDDAVNKISLFQALILARFVNGPVTLQEDATITGDYPIVLVAGSDWQGVRDANNPRPLSDFRQYLPPELQAAADQPQSATTVPFTLPPTTVPADVPQAPPGTECH